MAILFKNPILKRLEDLLWEKAKQRYIEEGNNPIDDINNVSKDVKKQLENWVEAWKSEEHKKIDLAWPEFKRVVTDKTQDALFSLLGSSQKNWYSVEIEQGIYPIILAVPYDVLYFWTEYFFPKVLAEKIQFKDMIPESLKSLSVYSMEKFFDGILRDAIKNKREFNIDKAFRPAMLVDKIEKDFYYLGDEDRVSRVNMVIISTFDDSFSDPTKKSKKKKEAIKYWQKIKVKTDGRPDDRRFSGQGWNLPNDFLENIAID